MGRFIIEFFRPDQPRVPGTDFGITRIANLLVVLAGGLLLLVKYEIVRLPFLSAGKIAYQIPEPPKEPRSR